ncbi:hypothetical protein SmJEL517_g00932 [Synchytrium microbalum]|uniref:FAD-binding domain-containing protein n=1 Tax=Synchytrium microbalum TaxID=1806994 RepID=A0A507CH87_9FUNG|nr:uncharacterized protein SmJEL517_g00932 [Synchytrium microbalum]TPX36923.1 hypothetical protein SmJEL517_g00932 [Synchytrium microbalum]
MNLDVLVVGGGPVGLMMASELCRYGLTFRIVDKAHDVNELSKAFGISARSMDILASRGLADEILRKANKIHKSYLKQGKNTIFSLSVVSQAGEERKTRFPYMSVLPQSDVEAILAEELERQMGRPVIERGIALDSYIDTPEGITATLIKTDRSGKEVERQVCKAKYIVGCDGVHSKVRKGVKGWDFDGKTLAQTQALGDVLLSRGNELVDGMSFFVHPKGALFAVRFVSTDVKSSLASPNSDRVRIGYNIDKYSLEKNAKVTTHWVAGLTSHQKGANAYDESVKITGFTIEDLRKGVEERTYGALSVDTHIDASTWVTTFKVNERIANGYRRGHAFVAGDAAHCHSPFGGRGLNTGIQDAHNLAFKLNFVIKGLTKSAEAVLGSYSIERFPVGQQTLAISGGMLQVATNTFADNPIGRGLMSLIFSVVFPHVASNSKFQEKARHMARQLNVNYTATIPNSILLRKVEPQLEATKGSLAKVGEYCPDAHLMNERLPLSSSLRQTTLHKLLSQTTKFTLVWLTGTDTSDPSKNPILSNFYTLVSKYSATVTGLQLSKFELVSSPSNVPRHILLASELGAACMPLFGASTKPVLVLVRPDLYVGMMVYAHSTSQMEKYLADLFGSNSKL